MILYVCGECCIVSDVYRDTLFIVCVHVVDLVMY